MLSADLHKACLLADFLQSIDPAYTKLMSLWLMMNCIYSINRPGYLLNLWTLRGDAYSRWALFRTWALIKFSPFSTSVVCIIRNKTVNSYNKTRRCNKARFLQNTLKKTPSSGKSYLFLLGGPVGGRGWALIWVWVGVEERWGGVEWPLILGWALVNFFCL